MYGNEKSVGFTPYDKSQGFSPTPANDVSNILDSLDGLIHIDNLSSGKILVITDREQDDDYEDIRELIEDGLHTEILEINKTSPP